MNAYDNAGAFIEMITSSRMRGPVRNRGSVSVLLDYLAPTADGADATTVTVDRTRLEQLLVRMLDELVEQGAWL